MKLWNMKAANMVDRVLRAVERVCFFARSVSYEIARSNDDCMPYTRGKISLRMLWTWSADSENTSY